MPFQVNDLTETQKAYLAGIFDGEGCISVNWWRGRLVVQIHVTNTDLPMLELIKAWTGLGKIRRHQIREGRKRNSFRWHMSWRDGAALMRVLEPYLVCKASQARMLIQAADSREWCRPKTPEQLKQDEALSIAMCAAKRIEYDR